MSVNGAFFQLRTLTIQGAATSARTYNAVSGGGISLSVGLRNESTASQTFNVPIGVDGSSVAFETVSGNLNFTNNFFLNANTAVFDGGNNTFVSGHIQGSGGSVTKNGSGLLIFANSSNNYTGSTTINAGTLRIGNDGGNGVLPTAVTNNGTLQFRRSNDYTYGQVISGTGQVVKGSGGVLTLSGNNTYSGATTIDAGTLRMTHANALGSTAAGTTVVSGASFELSGGLNVGSELLVLYGEGVSTIGALRNIAGNNSWSGQVSIGSDTRLFTETSTALDLSGVISSGGTYVLTKTGTGTLTISGSSPNTANGTLVLSAGTLNLSKSADTRAVDNVTVNSGATLNTNAANQWGTGTPGLLTANGTVNFNNHNQTIALAGTTGSIALGSANMTINNLFTDSYSGTISGTGSVVKTGIGTQTLAGTQSYTGSTTATGGTLFIGTSLASTTLVVNGGRLESTASNVINDAATLTVSSGTLDLLTDAIGNLTVSGTGMVELNASHTLTVSALSATADNRFSAASGSTLALASGTHSIQTETLHNLTLLPGATLTVEEGKTLTINGTLNLQGGTLVLAPGAIPATLVYGPSSELYYNTGTSVSPTLEWTSTLSPNSIRIGASTTVTLNSSDLDCTSLTIESGGTLDLDDHSLELRSSGTLTNNGTFTAGAGTIVFKGGNTVAGSSTTQFYNADLDGGGTNFGSNSQLSNHLRILAGAFVQTNRPVYGASATLIYETGANYDIFSTNREWELVSTTNNPPNVEIRSSSVVVDNTAGTGLRAGNLFLTNTGSLTLNPPTTTQPSFNLLLLNGDLITSGSSSLTVNNGDGIHLKPTANGAYDVRVNGSVLIGSSSTVTLNDDVVDDIYVREDFTINGSFLPSGRAVYFNGTALQTLIDSGSTMFNYVRVQNTSGLDTALLVLTDWSVENQLEVASGIVTTASGHTLFLEPDALLSFANINTGYLNGRTEQTKVLSGTDTIAIAYGLRINSNGNNLGSTTVLTISGPDGIVNPEGPTFAEGIAKRWDIGPTTQPSTDVELEFFWSTAHQNGKSTDDLFCWRLPNAATEWEVLNITAYDLADGNPVQTVSGFSGFTFSDGSNPLPVELVTFEGQAANGQVVLSWTTATEINSASFTVERSRDAMGFNAIGTLAAAGVSTRMREYSLIDQQPFPGMNYYRLRQTDLDGSEAFSKVISVHFAQAGPDAVFPVPTQDYLQVTWTLLQDGQVWLSLTDLAGRVLLRQQENAMAGINRFALNLAELPSGIYQLELRDAQGQRMGGAPVIRQ